MKIIDIKSRKIEQEIHNKGVRFRIIWRLLFLFDDFLACVQSTEKSQEE